tara:strand:- start:282 stop:1712 length:1431 start_codon:yes stop_codon:yes gene_type:complete
MPWDSAVSIKRILAGDPLVAKEYRSESYQDYLEDAERLTSLGGSQVGVYYAIRGGKQKYDKAVLRSLAQVSKDPNSKVVSAKQFFLNYHEWKKSGEMKNRVAEFQRVRDDLIDNGVDLYDAELQAMRASRDLIDFAVAGHTVEAIAAFIPFLNPAVQGLASTVRAGKRNPKLFGARLLAYSVLPSFLIYAWNMSVGAEDEYLELEDWRKSYAWNIWLPYLNKWLVIPKPFELGVPGTFGEMSVMWALGRTDPFSAAPDAMLAAAGPLQAVTSGFGPMFNPLVTRLTNWDPFYGTRPVPVYEEQRPLRVRDTSRIAETDFSRTGVAETLAKIISFDTTNLLSSDSLDPRTTEAILRTSFGTSGKQFQQAYNLAAAPSLEGLGDLFKYNFGNFLQDDSRPAKRSLSRYYEEARKLNSFPAHQTKILKRMQMDWAQLGKEGSLEDQVLKGREIVDKLEEFTETNIRNSTAQQKDFEEGN